MKNFLNNIFYRILIKYFRWIVNHSCIELSEHKNFKFVKGISNTGDFNLYVHIDKNGKPIIDSILLHCTKYDQHKEIPMTYIHRSWSHVMDGSVLYTIKNLSFDDAMNNMRKLSIETEIIEIKNEQTL